MKALYLLALLPALALADTRSKTPAEIVDLVFTSLYSDQDDTRLAYELERVDMSEQLDAHVVAYFRYIGIGPQALASLERLRDKSAFRPHPGQPPISIQPVPGPEDQQAILQRVAQYAQSYIQGLPNFLCEEVTEHYTNVSRSGAHDRPTYGKKLRHSDTVSWNLRFLEGVEDGSAQHMDDRKVKLRAAQKGQSLSMGEFGGDMIVILGSGAAPKIAWDHWQMFKGKRTAVFNYSSGAAHPRFTVGWFAMHSAFLGETGGCRTFCVRSVLRE